MYYIEDTNVISKAANDASFLSRLEEKRHELEHAGFSHAIAPPLLVELITGLAMSSDDLSGGDSRIYFQRDKFRFRLLYPWDRPLPTIFASPNAFALKTALNLDSPTAAALNEADFSRLVNIVFCAQSPDELWNTGVQISSEGGPLHTIDRENIRSRYEREIQIHLQVMGEAREGRIPSTQYEFARSILVAEGILLPHDHEVSILSKAVDGAYQYYCWLSDQAKNGYNFDSKKRKGDAMDYAFLPYLANPCVRFLTQDKDIKTRVGASTQAEQIIILH